MLSDFLKENRQCPPLIKETSLHICIVCMYVLYRFYVFVNVISCIIPGPYIHIIITPSTDNNIK